MRKMGKVKLFITCVLIILISGCTSLDRPSVLKGTYVCDKLPFASMVFDLDNDYTFYYYNSPDFQGSKMDKGTYSVKEDSKHVINSSNFNDETVTYDSEEHSFEIIINNETYLFKQISALPTIQN